MVAHNATYQQQEFRGRNDDDDEANATWKAAADADWSQAADEIVRIRFKIQQTTANANANLTKQFKVKFSHNGGAFGDPGAQGTTAQPVRYADSANLTDGEATTEQLMADFQFVAGEVFETAPSDAITFVDSARSETEVEVVLELVEANVSVDDTLVFRIYESDDTAMSAYTTEPTVTVVGPAVPVVIQLTPAGVGVGAQAISPAPAALAVQASPAVLTLAAQPTSPSLAARIVQAAPAILTPAASVVNPVVLGGPVNIQASPAVLTAQAQAPSPVLAALAIQAVPAELTTLAQVVIPVVAAQGVTITALPAVLGVAGQVLTPQLAAKAIQAVPATLAVSAQQVTPLIFVAHIEGNTFVVLDPSGAVAELADRGFAIAAIDPSKTEA